MLDKIGKREQPRPAFDLGPRALSRLANEFLMPQKKPTVVQQASPSSIKKAASSVQLTKSQPPSYEEARGGTKE